MNLRELERDSIRAFVAEHAPLFDGLLVLDYGAGTQPYRQLVEHAGGAYTPYDRPRFPGSVVSEPAGPSGPLKGFRWGGILSTQSIEYWPYPGSVLRAFRACLDPGGVLVMTGPGCWPEVEPTDLFRFTRAGIRTLLERSGFHVEAVVSRAEVQCAGSSLSLGWGAVARA